MSKGFKITIVIFFLFIFFVIQSVNQASEKAQKIMEKKGAAQVAPTTQQEYPSFSEETMDRDCILSCEGGNYVVLWDKPTASPEARLHNRVPCGTYCWAFNKYYNKEHNVTFYAINTNDKRVENAWGWLTEDLIIWRE